MKNLLGLLLAFVTAGALAQALPPPEIAARQYILMAPALDAEAFFTELAGVMRNGLPDQTALNAFGIKWSVEFLGPPLSPSDQPTD